MSHHTLLKSVGAVALLSLTAGMGAQAQTILTTSNGIVRSSLCVGTDCQSGISFVDSTIIVKENNTRIKFADTSAAASFPRNDWELEANSQTNGGPNRFSIFDCGENSNNGGCDEPDNVFSVEAGAGDNALYVDDGGRVGLGTGSPVVELHVVDGDTPTLRLEQNTSSGFAAQTWDIAGNETNYFIRDVTNGSRLPFRIRPGAETSSIDIENDGDVRIGHSSATAFQTDIRQNSGTSVLKLATTSGGAILQIDADNNGNFWNMTAATGDSQINFNRNDGDPSEMILDIDGNLTITGEITTSGSCSIGCDRVFDASYALPSIEEHAALMWSRKHLPNVGPTPESGAINVSDKVLRMLNELEHAHIYIAELHARLEVMEAAMAAR